jgi:hypothetical protein
MTMKTLLEHHLRNLREVIVLISLERCGLYEKLVSGFRCEYPPSTTSERVVLAAEALGLVDRGADGSFFWNQNLVGRGCN